MYSIFSLPKGKPCNYFALHRYIFKVLGISFSQTESTSYWIYSVIFLFCTTFTYPLVQCAELFKFYNNLDILAIIFGYGSVTLMGAVKAGVLLYNRKSIGKHLDILEEGVFLPNLELRGSQEALLIKKRIQLMNRQSFLYFGGVCTTVMLGVIDAVLKRIFNNDFHKWRFPAGYFSLFDANRSPNYEIICIYQTFCVAVCFGVAVVCDTLIGSILAHIAVQCKILQYRIRLMIENAYKKMLQDMPANSSIVTDVLDPSNIPWKYLNVVLRETVINHTEIINLAKNFESIFSYLILLQFLSTSATLCFALYYCSLFSPTDFKFIEYMIAVADVAIQVLFYCYWGNEVFAQSWKIADACNEVNFVGTDVRFQNGLRLIMLRSQRPIVLRAGKFTTLSLKTYVWIIRASYSYYMAIVNQR